MLNKRRKQKLPDYGVRFIGYSADIIARKGNADYASLDFVSGSTGLTADEGHLYVPKRAALSSAVADLPRCVDQLKSSVRSITPDSDGHWVELRGGEVSIWFSRSADIERFVSQLARRYRAIWPILEQAEKIGSEIKRPPYADYLDEMKKTGICRVVYYGFAFFVDGKLVYFPERQTFLVKPTDDESTFQILPHYSAHDESTKTERATTMMSGGGLPADPAVLVRVQTQQVFMLIRYHFVVVK
jgi:hypothetical protein